MRLTSLRNPKITGGTTTNAASDMMGSCTNMTTTRAVSVRKSRPIAVMTRLSAAFAAAAPVDRRASTSEL